MRPVFFHSLRPTLEETLLEACPGRTVHVWQMQMEVEESSGSDAAPMQEWVNLPLNMAQFADKHFAKYNMQVHEAKERHQNGKLSAKKLEVIQKNGTRPFVLMQATGQPATQTYVKTHLVHCQDGSVKLKDWDCN